LPIADCDCQGSIRCPDTSANRILQQGFCAEYWPHVYAIRLKERSNESASPELREPWRYARLAPDICPRCQNLRAVRVRMNKSDVAIPESARAWPSRWLQTCTPPRGILGPTPRTLADC
jgi:hypothetical protein